MREEYDFSSSSKNPYIDRLQEPDAAEAKRYKVQYPISAYTFPDNDELRVADYLSGGGHSRRSES